MSGLLAAIWVVVLGGAAAALAAVALWTRRPFFSSLALGGAGILLFAMLLAVGFAGLAVATLSCVWAVAASALVVGSTLSGIERAAGVPDRRGPWALALLASALLSGALALGLFAVDWPRPRGRAVPAIVAAHTEVAFSPALGEWLLAACAAAGALSLMAFAPAPDEDA